MTCFATVLNERVTNLDSVCKFQTPRFATVLNERVTNRRERSKQHRVRFATVLNERVTNPRIQFSTWNHAPAFLP